MRKKTNLIFIPKSWLLCHNSDHPSQYIDFLKCLISCYIKTKMASKLLVVPWKKFLVLDSIQISRNLLSKLFSPLIFSTCHKQFWRYFCIFNSFFIQGNSGTCFACFPRSYEFSGNKEEQKEEENSFLNTLLKGDDPGDRTKYK